ncbi:alpha/beta fold hydrolase [Streptomyces morookaense]|uniref:thioesterase II family protein n=1 Tax=Streptomyces morookaense TaxID=1970 RepID=UPI0033E540AF
MSAGRWLRRHAVEGRHTAARLVCFPHAGGTAAAFQGWPARLPADVETLVVQYPGRQDRIGEPCIEDMREMADRVTAELLDRCDVPLVLFGHSMGSGLAYEVARRLERDHGTAVSRLFVSARTAPHHVHGEKRHLLSDEDLVASMRSLGGPDAEVYDHPQLLPLILPPLRADLRLLDAYRPERAGLPRIQAPVTACGGDSDHTCPTADLALWEELTTAGAEVRIYPGGHHFLRTHEADVAGVVSKHLLTLVQTRGDTTHGPS